MVWGWGDIVGQFIVNTALSSTISFLFLFEPPNIDEHSSIPFNSTPCCGIVSLFWVQMTILNSLAKCSYITFPGLVYNIDESALWREDSMMVGGCTLNEMYKPWKQSYCQNGGEWGGRNTLSSCSQEQPAAEGYKGWGLEGVDLQRLANGWRAVVQRVFVVGLVVAVLLFWQFMLYL